MAELFTNLVKQGRQNMMRPGFVDSRDWFREKASEVKRVNTVVNRGICIGEHGTHFGPITYQQHKLHLQEPYIFESDKDIKEFILG